MEIWWEKFWYWKEKKGGGGGGQGSFTWNYERKGFGKNHLKMCVCVCVWGGGGPWLRFIYIEIWQERFWPKLILKGRGVGRRRVLGQASFTWNYDRERFWWEEKMGGGVPLVKVDLHGTMMGGGGGGLEKGVWKKEVLPLVTEVSHQQSHTTSVGGDVHSVRSRYHLQGCVWKIECAGLFCFPRRQHWRHSTYQTIPRTTMWPRSANQVGGVFCLVVLMLPLVFTQCQKLLIRVTDDEGKCFMARNCYIWCIATV